MIIALSMNTWAQGMLAAYLGAGCGVGWLLRRKGQSDQLALTATIAWPVLLPLLGTMRPQGPMHDRIQGVLDSFSRAIKTPELAAPELQLEVDSLTKALFDADQRLGVVDRLLQESTEQSPTRERLEQARTRCADQIETVLAEVGELRLQAGLQALSGGADALKERLQELSARAMARAELDEFAS